ncbi:DUF4123 domain-containing protein [Trinickia symbiotica]|uniref:DUF4123 domain-containing protein n=1 Tax=Trinickia symbiotica TaxID=863227 RepID=UPI0021593414|nr:DUF4123 domain-containing protein [Trinickia symbiotica]
MDASDDQRRADAESVQIEAATIALRRHFERQHRDMHCLLVVDSGMRALPPAKNGKPTFEDLPRAVIEVDHPAFPAEHQPYLLTLDLSQPQDCMLLFDSVRVAYHDRRPDDVAQGLGQRIGGWLASSLPADEVAAHWSKYVLQQDGRERTCALRFYDARALSLLWPVLTLMQQETLLGPVKAWYALDACAELRTYKGLYPPSRAELLLKPGQWNAIHRHGLINRALALHMAATGRQPTPDEVKAAVASAERAEHFGLTDKDDMIAFIGHALAWHPYFDSHPRVIEALREVSTDCFYTAAVSTIRPEEIEEIRSGSWLAGQKNGTSRSWA